MTTERVTYRPEGERARTIYLADVAETAIAGAPAIAGVEVDRDGCRVLGTVDQAVERRHIIQTELVVRRVPVVMDNTYGEFVEVGK